MSNTKYYLNDNFGRFISEIENSSDNLIVTRRIEDALVFDSREDANDFVNNNVEDALMRKAITVIAINHNVIL